MAAPPVRRGLVVLALTAALTAACGGSPGSAPTPGRPPLSGEFTPRKLPRPVPTAAEPAASPVPTVRPAGRVLPIGNAPEGIVADPTTRLVAVAVRDPDQLVLLDSRTLAVRHRTALPGSLRHLRLAADGGPVLVPDESADALVSVALPSGRVLAQTPTGDMPHDAARAADGTVLVANEAGATVVAIRDGQVVRTYDDVTQPGGVASVDGTFGVVDVGENTITFVDAASLQPVTELSAGEGPTHLVPTSDGRYVVVDTRGGALLVYAPPPRAAQLTRFALPGQPYGIAYDPQRKRVWVSVTATNEVVGVDVSGANLREVARYPTVQQPNTVAVDPRSGRLFVTGTTPGTLEIIDPV